MNFCSFADSSSTILNKKTATLANLSEPTVKRYLTNKIKDPSFLIIQALSYALICDPQGKQPCPIHLFPDEVEQATVACKAAQDALVQKGKEFEQALESERKKVDYLKEQSTFKDEQIRAKDKVLEDYAGYIRTKDRYIGVLICLLALAVAAILISLVIA